MNYKHWFFDLDGTLARTGEDIVVAWKGALAALGRDLTRFDEVFRIGPPLEKIVYDLYDDATPELVAELLERFKPLYDESGFPNTVPYEGVPELLRNLKTGNGEFFESSNGRMVESIDESTNRRIEQSPNGQDARCPGAKIYIATNKRRAPTLAIAKKFGWDRLFDGVWSYDSLEVKYKKPELLARLMADLGIAAQDAVMVGDTKGDVDAGKQNGMATIGVTWGYGTREELSAADEIFDSPIDFVVKYGATKSSKKGTNHGSDSLYA